MKSTIKTVLVAFAMMGFMGLAHAQDHAGQHTEGQKTETKMDKGQMKGMMHECVTMHKDGKMCDHDMMEKCQKQMGEGECQKMMKEAKGESKKATK
jgi:hypothetical protein